MAEESLPITGGCLCGAVRYEATEPPTDSCYCHCRMCQRWTGSPVLTGLGFRMSAVRITRGEPKFYASSSSVERGFCGECGSNLMMRYAAIAIDEFWVFVGTLDHPENAAPQRHIGIESKIPWFVISDDLPQTRSEDEPGTVDYKQAGKQRDG